jgi:hypothetical protein
LEIEQAEETFNEDYEFGFGNDVEGDHASIVEEFTTSPTMIVMTDPMSQVAVRVVRRVELQDTSTPDVISLW